MIKVGDVVRIVGGIEASDYMSSVGLIVGDVGTVIDIAEDRPAVDCIYTVEAWRNMYRGGFYMRELEVCDDQGG